MPAIHGQGISPPAGGGDGAPTRRGRARGGLAPSCQSPPPGEVRGCPRPQTNFVHILWKNLICDNVAVISFAPDLEGGGAGDVRFMLTVSVKATLRPGAVRARGVRRTPLGWQPIPCLPQWQLGGRRKASLTFTRAARPEGGVGDSQEEGEPYWFTLLLCACRA